MININYQLYGTKGFNLRLRLYQDGETKFINVNKLLTGNLTRKHWNVKRKCLYPSAPDYERNSDTLYSFKKKYEDAAAKWKGSLRGFLMSMGDPEDVADSDKPVTFVYATNFIINDMKSKSMNPDGTLSEGFTAYEKLLKRMDEFCKVTGMDFNLLTLEEVSATFVNQFLAYVTKKGTGRCLYVSQTLHAVLNKSSKYGWYDIKRVENCNWMKKTGKSVRKYETLTTDQCKLFMGLKESELPKSKLSKLYHDFCVFIFYTCQSTCDALSLRYDDIQNINGRDHFVFKRRKIAEKQSTDCLVPINSVMREIMDRYKGQSRDGYIFPVRSRQRMDANVVNNGDIKHFISRLNIWLKKLSPSIGCPFNLHSYVFRHTGITHYISKGVSHVYVANLAGTSVKNIEQIYYNNQADVTNRNLVLDAII